MKNIILEKVDKVFSLKKNDTNFTREIIAGFTTFSAMSYILVANPTILAAAGMDKATLISVTAIAAAFACILMAFVANLPIALAPTMGSNAFIAFVVCLSMGLRWQEALALVFYNGLFFLFISITGLREKLLRAVPRSLHVGLQSGIGLFIAFLGLQSGGLVVSDPNTLVTFPPINSPEILFTLVGVILMSVLYAKKVSGGILISILIMTFIGLFVVGSNGAKISQIPTSILSIPSGISSSFLALDFAYPFKNFSQALPIIFTLLIVDVLDTLGTLIAMGKVTGLMDNKGYMNKTGKVFFVDSVATIVGSLLGTSTTGVYVESATGIHAGGRTGLTSLVVGILFLLTLFFSPIISIVPVQAVAPSLIIVGLLMLASFKDLDFSDFAEFMPAVFCMLVITLSFKISEGFAFGLISYVILMLATKRAKNIHIFTWGLFLLMIIFLIQ